MRELTLSLAAWLAHWMPSSIKQRLYHLGPLTGWIRRSLNKSAPAGIVETIVAGGPLRGTHLLLNLYEEKEYWLGTYEPNLQSALTDWIKPGWIIYDVGANIGYISLLISKMIGKEGKVIAFEALPANVERLKANLSMNQETSNVLIVPAAVTNVQSKVRFLISNSCAAGKVDGSAGHHGIYQNEVDVPGITLDHFIYDQGNPIPHMIKMDIEGGESLALGGMTHLLSTIKPLMMIELHGSEANQIVWNTLCQAQYKLYHIKKGYPQVLSTNELGKRSYILAKSIS
jgi:FkbM family methyltransferase